MKTIAAYNDSGFFDDNGIDFVMDNSKQLDYSSDSVLMVEDDAFDIIESSLESLLQDDEDQSTEESFGPLETSTPQPLRRKRGRPAKSKPIEDFSTTQESANSDTTPETVKRKRGRPAKIVSIAKDDEELLLMEEESPLKKMKENVTLLQDDEDQSTEESFGPLETSTPQPLRRMRGRPTKSRCKPSLPDYEDLSPYEKIRADNIKQREEMLLSLGIKEAFSEYKSDVGLGSRTLGYRKPKLEQVERRRSSRLEGKDDSDYVPEVAHETNDDPSDHTHDGLRKHPCKECTNCVMPDCRWCIFCRDKKMYGGPNLKKQKCEQKEKCSQPIILCFICQGKRVFSCLACGKQFHETYELEEHNREVHETQQVRRRSARLTEKVNLVN